MTIITILLICVLIFLIVIVNQLFKLQNKIDELDIAIKIQTTEIKSIDELSKEIRSLDSSIPSSIKLVHSKLDFIKAYLEIEMKSYKN